MARRELDSVGPQLEEEKLKNDEAEFHQQFIFGDYSRSPLEQLLPLAQDVYLPMLVKSRPVLVIWGLPLTLACLYRRICGRAMWCQRCARPALTLTSPPHRTRP